MRIGNAGLQYVRERYVRTGMRLAIVALPAALLSGCGDGAPDLMAPRPGLERAVRTTRTGVSLDIAGGLAAGVARCDIATRTPSRTYRFKTAYVAVADDGLDPGGQPVTFGVREWTPGVSDPARLVVCSIPNTAAAAMQFKTLFSVSRLAPSAPPTPLPRRVMPSSMGKVMASPSSQAAQVSARSTDVNALLYDVHAQDCTQDFGCECPPEAIVNCSDPNATTGEWDGPPPTDADQSDFSISESGAPPLDFCYGQTDVPHNSGTPGFFNRVNVHARTSCPTQHGMYVATELDRQRCIWIFCWWSNENADWGADYSLKIEINVPADCKKGFWRAFSVHSVMFITGPQFAFTYSTNDLACP